MKYLKTYENYNDEESIYQNADRDPRMLLADELQKIGVSKTDANVIALDVGSSQVYVNKNYLEETYPQYIDIIEEISNCIKEFYGDEEGYLTDYYRDKQSGEILSDVEMMGMVDEDDMLDSFIYIGAFTSRKEAEDHFNSGLL